MLGHILEGKIINYLILVLYLGERLLELLKNHFNKKILIEKKFAVIKYPSESLQMKAFHGSWFVLLFLETYLSGKLLSGFGFTLSLAALVFAQILRWYSIITLGRYWSIDIYEMKEHPIIDNGPYRYIKHPNYLAVIIEFIFLPLLLGCYLTLIIGLVGNYFILKRRIILEELALVEQSQGLKGNLNYHYKFLHKNRFILRF
jgi:methyltransferase